MQNKPRVFFGLLQEFQVDFLNHSEKEWIEKNLG